MQIACGLFFVFFAMHFVTIAEMQIADVNCQNRKAGRAGLLAKVVDVCCSSWPQCENNQFTWEVLDRELIEQF